MLGNYVDAILSDKTTFFILLVSIAVIIFGTIIICVSLKQAREKESVVICSSRLRAIKELNAQYRKDFFDIKPYVVYKKSVKTRTQAEQFNFDAYMNEIMESHFDELSQLVCEAKSNNNKLCEYFRNVERIKNIDSTQDAIDSGVPEERYFAIEKKQIDRIILDPESDPKVVLKVSYISPKGRSTYVEHKEYSIVQVKSRLEEFQRKKESRSFSYIERGKMTPKLRYQVLQRDGHRCAICGRSAEDGVTLEVDHIFPVSKGGKTELNNLRTLCRDCNRGKGSKFEEYGIN